MLAEARAETGSKIQDIKSLEPVEESVNQRISGEHPHSVLHEILVHAHLNRLIQGHGVLDSSHYSGNSEDLLKTVKEKVDANHQEAKNSGKKTRKPSIAEVEASSIRDAENIHKSLASSHGWKEDTRAHWTPDNSSRKKLHKDETHSGDITVVNHKNNKSTAPSASINLKWGKGVSLPVPRQSAITSFFRGRLRKKVRRVFKAVKKMPQNQEKDDRDRHIGRLADQHVTAFNKLPQEDKFSFMKRMYGISDSASPSITSYTHHSGSDTPTNNHDTFNRLFPNGINHKFDAVRSGRGMRILRDGTHLRTLSWRYNKGKLEPNLKNTKNEKT